jgi:hypothetical protein
LQNNDELNFGVSGFWSYFFPFPKVAVKFEEILDAWIEGRARIARRSLTRAFKYKAVMAPGAQYTQREAILNGSIRAKSSRTYVDLSNARL